MGVIGVGARALKVLVAVATFAAATAVLGPPAAAVAASPGAVVDSAACTVNSLAANDDGSTASVGIGFEVNYFGQRYSDLYVNNNGNVTFDAPLRSSRRSS